MYPHHLFLDICLNPIPLNTALQWMNMTRALFFSSEKLSFQNLSIVNKDCKYAHKNKIQLEIFKCTIDYYERDSVTVFDVLKQEHYQILIIINNDHNFVGCVLHGLSPTEGSFKFFLHIDEYFRSKGFGTLLLQILQKEITSKL